MKDSLTFFGCIAVGLLGGYLIAYPFAYAGTLIDEYEVNRSWK